MANSKFNPFAGFVEHFSSQVSSSPAVIPDMGRFEQALSEELIAGGTEVLCVDHREKVVQKLSPTFDHAVTADATMPGVLKQLSVDKTERVVIAIGNDIRASLLIASALMDMGVPPIWAETDNRAHAKILGQIGVHHVTRPETDTGRRIAHLIGGKVQDFLRFDRDYAMGRVVPPIRYPDRTVAGINQGAPIVIVAVQKHGQRFRPALADDYITTGGLLIVSGTIRQLKTFAGE